MSHGKKRGAAGGRTKFFGWQPYLSAGMGLLLAAIPFQAAIPHPHSWIDLTVQVIFDESGKAVALRETWLFDESYTAFAVKQGRKTPSQAHIDSILKQNMKSLAPYSYFTKAEYRDEKLEFAPVAEMSAALQKDRLAMTFVLPFQSPLDLNSAALSYSIFDPTYYIEMLHEQSETAVQLVGAAPGCTYDLIGPSPTFESVSLAQALDATQTAGDGLGTLFAQKVLVQCP